MSKHDFAIAFAKWILACGKNGRSLGLIQYHPIDLSFVIAITVGGRECKIKGAAITKKSRMYMTANNGSGYWIDLNEDITEDLISTMLA